MSENLQQLRTLMWFAVSCVGSWVTASPVIAESVQPGARVVATIQDFESSRPGVFNVYRQLDGSELEIIAAPHADVIDGTKSLRVRTAPTDKAGDGRMRIPHVAGEKRAR